MRVAVEDPLAVFCPDDPAAVEAPFVFRLLRRAGLVEDGEIHGFERSAPLSGGQSPNLLFRYTVRYRAARQDQTASAILKLVRLPLHSEGGGREFHFYADRFWQRLPREVAAPHPLLVVDRPLRRQRWLWLEDCAEALPAEWTLDGLADAARDLAALHAHFADQQAVLLAVSWLPPDDWHADLPRRDWLLAGLERLRQHPRLRQLFTAARCALLRQVLEATERLAAHLDRMPRTVLHNDAHGGNLGMRWRDGRRQTVLLDWPNVALGPFGAELAPLVSRSVIYRRVPPEQRPLLERAALDAYCDEIGRRLPGAVPASQVWLAYDRALLARHLSRMLGSAIRLYTELAWWSNPTFTPEEFEQRLAAEALAWEQAALRLGFLQSLSRETLSGRL